MERAFDRAANKATKAASRAFELTVRQIAVLRYLTLRACVKPGYDAQRTKLVPCAKALFLQGFDGALEVHAARAFEEHDVAFAKVLLEPDAGLAGTFDELRGDAAGASTFDDLGGEAAHANDGIEAAHLFACGAVQRGAFRAELEHLAGDDEAARGGRLAERFNHRGEGPGVGVVGVVDKARPVELEHAAALFSRAHLFDGGDAGVDVDVAEQADADGRECVEHVVAADEAQVNLAAEFFDGKSEARAVEAVVADVVGANVGA